MCVCVCVRVPVRACGRVCLYVFVRLLVIVCFCLCAWARVRPCLGWLGWSVWVGQGASFRKLLPRCRMGLCCADPRRL